MNTYKKITMITVALILVATSSLVAEGVREVELIPAPEVDTMELTLSSQEDGILLMREEEKLARDVYLALYEMWGNRTFANIARAEQQHMDAVAYLMQQQGVTDPVEYAAPGEFTIKKMQDLYDSLIEQGSLSEIAALKVGALIEDLDIADIEHLLETAEDELTIRVWENLLAGSEMHMRAFIGQLEMAGETYEPEYISSERLDDILAESGGRGPSARGRRVPMDTRDTGRRGWN
ncbi:MAG: DUF2202 domain-containing protein [Sphaerochaetaceae bacterium]|nr:DUF2202 domain-containing protein [Sphaerochaetaceae bacterium]